MNFHLQNGLPDDFAYAASVKIPYRAEFSRDGEGLVNGLLKQPVNGEQHQYVSAILKRPVRLAAGFALETSFDHFGAPLIVLAEEVRPLPNGWLQYGLHYEAVLFQDGINLWRLEIQPDGTQKAVSLCKAKMPFEAGRWTKLTLRATRQGLEARAGDLVAHCECTLPETVWAGFTACEGINHFRSFAVWQDET